MTSCLDNDHFSSPFDDIEGEFDYYEEEIPDNLVLSQEEEGILCDLARYYKSVVFEGREYKKRAIPISPLGLRVFEKGTLIIDGEKARVNLSSQGCPDMKLSDLSVLSKNVHTLCGSGKRLMTEWWEKKNGYEISYMQIITELKTHNFCVFFEKGDYYFLPCSSFLAEGAELVGDVIWVREECKNAYIQGRDFVVKVVEKHNFGDRIPSGIEGIIGTIDGQLYRLKEEHTLDLRIDGNKVYDADGNQEFVDQVYEMENGLYEFTMEGKIVRKRIDKKKADNRLKCDKLKNLKKLNDLKDLMKSVRLEKGKYTSSQWVGYNELTLCEGDPIIQALEKLRQVMTIDHRKLMEEFNGCKSLNLDDYTDDKGYFDYTTFIKRLRRSGWSFKYADVRRDLVHRGIYRYYDTYRVLRGAILGHYCPRSWVRLRGDELKVLCPAIILPDLSCSVLVAGQFLGSVSNVRIGNFPTSEGTEVINAINDRYDVGDEDRWKRNGILKCVPKGPLLRKIEYLVLHMVHTIYGGQSTIIEKVMEVLPMSKMTLLSVIRRMEHFKLITYRTKIGVTYKYTITYWELHEKRKVCRDYDPITYLSRLYIKDLPGGMILCHIDNYLSLIEQEERCGTGGRVLLSLES